ncbi:MAG: hypothetical protein HOP10_12105 [Chitinophagaceae bacterium]|nr:hypothetical protein [Chitinophagaceae bacterium]
MKRKKVIIYIIITVFILVGIAALYIYKEYTRTHTDTALLKPDYSLEATSLVKAFETDEQASNKKFWDKVIRVEGVVKDVIKDEKGFFTLALGDTSSMSSVRCSIDSVHSKEAANVQKGSLIAIKGICSGFNADELLGSDVILVRSVVDRKK